MTQQQVRTGLMAWFTPTNATTIISAIGLAWMIMWQGGGYAVRRANAFTDTVEVSRQRSLDNQSNLSAYTIRQQVRDNGQDADISNVRNMVITK